MASTKQEYHLNVHANGKSYRLDYPKAFQFGYSLLRTRKFQEAAKIFETMIRGEDPDRSAAVMLAYCKAGIRDYASSSAILCEVFADESERIKADQCHTAFVYMSVGMWADAIEELTSVIRQSRNLSSICLLLGDLFMLLHKPKKAFLCWKMALQRDPSGAIGLIARLLMGPKAKFLDKKSENP